MSGSNLPPVRHLPHWTRVGRLGKPCSPRRLPANHLPVVPPADRGVGTPAVEVPRHGDVEPRVVSMQRNIQFLQQQHKDTLEKLHAEIEYLRRENKGEESHSCYCFSPVMWRYTWRCLKTRKKVLYCTWSQFWTSRWASRNIQSKFSRDAQLLVSV